MQSSSSNLCECREIKTVRRVRVESYIIITINTCTREGHYTYCMSEASRFLFPYKMGTFLSHVS
ncbi:hypothetical protein AALO_G00209030 [Alosa alosa]|uniref:Uncharacterized protein n=1 Tax=Alosa alosa TaxID=278164 RepID=A0AAV6FZB3_9TELE|nr:hypothetical protein AALO_G00209030 [Alosa alosa]